MKKSSLATAVLLSLCAVPAVSMAAEPDYTLTGNVNVFSDYRFRGVSQTVKGPALQGGFDFAHKSGFYAGNWNSNVSGQQYNGGNGLEMDVYAGYKGDIGSTGLSYDVGNLYYYYDKARVGGVTNGEKYNNNELYGSLSYGPVSAKLSYATTDYFGLNAASAPASNLNPNGDSKGTTYAELNYSQEVMPKLTAVAHVGRTNIKNYGALNYTDYKIGATYDLNGFALGAAVVGTTSRGNGIVGVVRDIASGTGNKDIYGTTLVLSVGKTF